MIGELREASRYRLLVHGRSSIDLAISRRCYISHRYLATRTTAVMYYHSVCRGHDGWHDNDPAYMVSSYAERKPWSLRLGRWRSMWRIDLLLLLSWLRLIVVRLWSIPKHSLYSLQRRLHPHFHLREPHPHPYHAHDRPPPPHSRACSLWLFMFIIFIMAIGFEFWPFIVIIVIVVVPIPKIDRPMPPSIPSQLTGHRNRGEDPLSRMMIPASIGMSRSVRQSVGFMCSFASDG